MVVERLHGGAPLNVLADFYDSVQFGNHSEDWCQALDNVIWGKRRPPDSSAALVPNLGDMVETALSAKCGAQLRSSEDVRARFDGKDKVYVTIKDQPFRGDGFELNGMDFCLPAGVEAGLILLFELEDSKLVLKEATFDFSRPFLGRGNFLVGLGAAFSYNNIGMAPYDQHKSSFGERPMVFAFDRLRLKRDMNDGDKSGVYLSLVRYKKDRWGSYVFESKEDECKKKTSGFKPAQFLGDGLAGDGLGKSECRYTELGPRTSVIIRDWIFKNGAWEKSYDEYLVMTDENPVGAMLWLANSDVIQSGTSGCDYNALAAEEEKLGAEYLRWKKRR